MSVENTFFEKKDVHRFTRMGEEEGNKILLGFVLVQGGERKMKLEMGRFRCFYQ